MKKLMKDSVEVLELNIFLTRERLKEED